MGEGGGGKWRWDDAHELFEADFVDSAAIREGDWREREKQGARERKDAAKAARKRRRRKYRLPAFAVLLVLVVLGVATALGKGPTTWLRATNEQTSAPPGTVATTAVTTSLAPTTSGPAVVPGSTPTTERDEREIDLISKRRGDCFIWDEADTSPTFQSATALDCHLPHVFEYAADVDISAEATHYLTAAEWALLIRAKCQEPAEALFEGPIDPMGRFTITALRPTRKGWEAGDRTLRCGIGSGVRATDAPRGVTVPLTSAARSGGDQTYVAPPGSCAAAVESSPVSCTQPHAYEMAGVADLSGRPGAVPAPGDDAGWQAFVGDSCFAVARTYLGRPLRADEQVSYFRIEQRTWDLGRHTIVCAVQKGTGTIPLTVTGSIKGT